MKEDTSECTAKEKTTESALTEITTETAVKEQTTESTVKDEVCDLILDSPSVEFTIIHNKDKYTVSMPLLSTIAQLKDKLVDMIGVPSKMQKIMIKGLAKDDQTLESLNVSSSSKIMVVGAKLQDIVAVSVANVEEVCETIVFKLFQIYKTCVLFRNQVHLNKVHRLKNHYVRKNYI